jgi:hypothetical protein
MTQAQVESFGRLNVAGRRRILSAISVMNENYSIALDTISNDI